ncbi:hypothetical protein [Tolypothrix sp. VBCCA 56010]|uniref:hypothetical protein n=1 Tax=Tolypothrix sp. VBCCA 56010 TaxID=3137731 RepID=UPI003D7DFBB1
MKNKKSRAIFCWFPFVNRSGLDYSTQARLGTTGLIHFVEVKPECPVVPNA